MIDILKVIYSILINDPNITQYVGNKIFPVVVPDKDNSGENIDYPLLVMIRSSIEPEYSKGCVSNISTVSIYCFSTQYYESVDMAIAVRDALEFYKGTVDGITISQCRLISASEDFTENAYSQLLTFEIR